MRYLCWAICITLLIFSCFCGWTGRDRVCYRFTVAFFLAFIIAILVQLATEPCPECFRM